MNHITVSEYFKHNGMNSIKLISINASPCRHNSLDFIVARFLLTGRVFVSNFSCQAFSCTCNTLHNFMHQREVEQAGRCGPEGTRRFRLPDFHDIRHFKGGEVVILTHRPPLPQGMFLVPIFTRG
jgi:hypothetical protein